MQVLKDLPPGTIWPHLLESIEFHVIDEIKAYAAGRQSDVERGAETPELAAILVEKYGAGLAKALNIVGIDSTVQTVADQLVREIDPKFDENRKARWAARPAGVVITQIQVNAKQTD